MRMVGDDIRVRYLTRKRSGPKGLKVKMHYASITFTIFPEGVPQTIGTNEEWMNLSGAQEDAKRLIRFINSLKDVEIPS